MKKTFYILVLLFLCAGFAAAADSAVKQAHRANADGALTNSIGNSPEALRHGAGLSFDTSNPVKVNKKGKGPTKKYTYQTANGNTYNIDLNNNIPQPSKAVDATNETADQNNNSANTNEPKNTPAKTNTAKQEQDSKVPYYQQLKEWAAKHKDPNDTDGDYARKRETPLRDYSVEQEDNIKPQTKNKKTYKHLKPGEENLPTEEKDRLEKSRKQAAKKKAQSEQAPAEQEEWVDPVTKAKTQEEVRELLKKEYLNPEFKQYLKEKGVGEEEFIDKVIASHKEYQRLDYTGPVAKQPAQNNTADEETILPMTPGMRMLLTVRNIDPKILYKANNQPVNNQVKTVKKFKLAADIIKADKTLSEKEKQEFLEWDAKIRRQAEELKEQERQEQERKNRELEEAARNRYMELKKYEANKDDVLYGKYDQICDPKFMNSSDAVCAICCMHPKTAPRNFNPNTHVIYNGYIDSRDNECHCSWQGRPLTEYSTRNTSQQACNAYCLAHPEDTKGFNPEKHQMHYGQLKKAECKCHYVKKDVDICSWKSATSSDEACTRCCMEQPGRNCNASGFDPSKHTMLFSYVQLPRDKYRYCSCSWVPKPELRANVHASITGASVDAPTPAYGDEAYTLAVCDQNFVNQSHGNCTKCCLAKQPQAPKAGLQLDYGYLNNGRCKCHFSNPNAGVCDNERKLASDSGCYDCCVAQPPANFNPDTDEMSYGRVVGNNCECHWKTRPQQTYNDDSDEGCSFEEKNRSQSACNRCCTRPSEGLIGGELESDGICVCLHEW